MDPVTRKNHWRETIERCLSSGLTISKWCELNKIAPSTLYSWMARFRKEEDECAPERNASEWIEVTKDALTRKLALAPTTQVTDVATALCKPDDRAVNAAGSPPAIHTRINGIEMSIPTGSKQADIEAVFKAAISL
jgi:transposase-like protein